MLAQQWLRKDFLGYLKEWEEEVKVLPLSRKQQLKCCLSRETLEGMKISSKNFDISIYIVVKIGMLITHSSFLH